MLVGQTHKEGGGTFDLLLLCYNPKEQLILVMGMHSKGSFSAGHVSTEKPPRNPKKTRSVCIRLLSGSVIGEFPFSCFSSFPLFLPLLLHLQKKEKGEKSTRAKDIEGIPTELQPVTPPLP